MFLNVDSRRQSALIALEAAVVSAREGFACIFSTSDEYERALISMRRDQGRYRSPGRMTAVVFMGAVLAVGAAALLLI